MPLRAERRFQPRRQGRKPAERCVRTHGCIVPRGEYFGETVWQGGRDVPLKNPDWPKFVQGLREAGRAAYKAALTKHQDKILDASEVIANACENCRDQYRGKVNLADRCK
jgi:hypothetical protein